MIGQIGATAMSAAGSYFSSKTSKLALESQARIADVNARLAELSAQTTLLQGQREEQNARLKTGALKSAQRVGLAANGLDLGSATAANVLTTTDVMGEVDANTIAANAVRAAWGYRTQGVNSQNEAIMKRATASGIDPAGSAVSSLLSGAGQVAGSWYSLNKVGALKGTAFELKS